MQNIDIKKFMPSEKDIDQSGVIRRDQRDRAKISSVERV